MDDLLNTLIAEFKKQKIIRGNIYDNFMFFCYHALGADKDDKFAIEILNKTFILKKHEIGKLSQTLNDSIQSIQVGYQIGTYL
jgi:hypothetical protein